MPLTVDYLKEDPEIYNQKFVCLSFAEPRDQDVLRRREAFFASSFLSRQVEMIKSSMEAKLNGEVHDEVKLDSSLATVTQEYEDYLKTFENDLQRDFENQSTENEATTMRGIKVRGVFRNYEEAQQRAEQMREFEPAFDVFVGQVGYWMPFNPMNVDGIQAQYAEEQLNNLIKGKLDEEEKAKLEFNKRKEELLSKVKEETKEDLVVEEVVNEEELLDVIDEAPIETQTQKESKKARRGGRRRRRARR